MAATIVNHIAIFTGRNGRGKPSDLLVMQNSDEETIVFDCMFEDGSVYTFSAGDVVTGNFTSITTGVGYVVSGIITPETDGSTMAWVCDPADVGLPDVYDLSFEVETTGGLFAHTKIFKYTIVEVPGGVLVPASPLVGVPADDAAFLAGVTDIIPNPNDLLPVDDIANASIWFPNEPAASDYIALSGATTTADIMALWEALRDDDYCTRELLGVDQSGSHNIYAYTFEPPSPSGTLFLTCSIHGGELVGSVSTYRTMHNVINNWQDSAVLKRLRWDVKIVIIPVANPWGVDNGQARKNSNGVDINRNFDYRWADFTPSLPADVTYKGTAAESEAETQLIVAKLAELAADDLPFIAAMDFHDTGMTTKVSPVEYYGVPVDFRINGGSNFAIRLVNTLKTTTDDVTLTPTDAPALVNFSAFTHDTNSFLAEYEQGSFGYTTALDTNNMSASIRWYGNLMYRSIAEVAPKENKNEMFVRAFDFVAGTSNIIIPTVTGEIAEFTYEIDIPGPGLLVFNGTVIVGAGVGLVYLYPVAGMSVGGAESLTVLGRDERYVRLQSATDRMPIAFTKTAMVTSYQPSTAIIRIHMNAPATTYVYRYNSYVQFIPAKEFNRWGFASATGRGGSGAGAMQDQTL